MKEKILNFKVILVILLLVIIYLLVNLNHNTTLLYKTMRFLPSNGDIDSIESELSDVNSTLNGISDEIWKLK